MPGEPIAVAFVEVRPETTDFRSNAERDIQQGLGPEGLSVSGQFKLSGLDTAKRDVSELTRDLRGVSGQQLQFDGLQDASTQAAALAGSLQQAGDVDLARNLKPAADAAAQLSDHANAVATAVAAIPQDIAPDASGLSAAAEGTAALAEQTGNLGSTLGTAATAASALIARQEQVARSEQQVSAALAQETAQVRQSAIEEERLIRVRARRATSIGPFRLAGIGLLAGTAIFSATRAVGDLAEGLRVTGDEAGTLSGKLRNAAASLLSGDVVGVFRSLTDNTRSLSIEQLKLIQITPELSKVLRDLGEGANIARSQTAALAGASQVPQFIQTRISQTQAEGDTSGQRAALEKALADSRRREQLVRDIGGSEAEVNAALDAIFRQRAGVRGQLQDLTSDTRLANLAASVERAKVRRDPEAIADALRSQRSGIEKLIAESRGAGQQRDELTQGLRTVNEKIRAANIAMREAAAGIVNSQGESLRGVLGLGPSAGASALTDIVEREQAIVEQLKKDRVRLQNQIDELSREAGAAKGLKDKLAQVDADIEQTRQAIIAEQERHRQAVIANRLAPSEEAIVDAQLSGSGEVGALQQRAAAIQAILDQNMIDGKKLSRDERIRLKDELVSVNGQIESAQAAITSESERHASEIQKRQDDSDQAFLDAIGGREGRGRNAQLIAQASAGLGDDIRTSERLQAIFRESIRTAKTTIRNAVLKAQTIAQLTTSLIQETQNERQLRQQQRSTRVSNREESLDLDIQIAQANENRQAELRAHRAKIRFLEDRIRHTREGTNQRKRLIAELRQEQAAERELLGAAKDAQGASFATISFNFLQQLAGFSSNLAPNLQTNATTRRAPRTTTTQEPTAPRPPISRPTREPGDRGVPSPFSDRASTSSSSSQASAAQALRDQGGAPASQGQMSELITVGKRTNLLLNRIANGVGHQEAKAHTALARNANQVGVD